MKEHELDIAIVGMAGRFPGAENIEAFWDNLVAGKESIQHLTEEQLENDGISPSTYKDEDYIKKAPTIKDYDKFDADFFGYSPREARMMDPQQRLFLECAWQTMENAGYNPHEYKQPIGVFGGTAMNTYFIKSGLADRFSEEYLPTLIGNDNSFLTTRVSYKLDLRGPSATVQTACSTGLVAVHMACTSLLNYESTMALAGAVSVRVPHHAGYLPQEGSVFSRDGHCRPFDANASGTIFGSGAGMVLLKRYADAVEDGDHIWAVIKGSAINNDGSSKTDYTAPSVNSQAGVIVEALATADINAETISYVEAHGTGTYLGDPIELRALTKAYRLYTEKKGYCAIGSVKSNIGHLDAAAGISGFIKTAMSLYHKKIPASLHFEKPNPEIDFGNSPFYVNTTSSDWITDDTPRRAGITSLGMGGTNAHVILEEYIPELKERNQTERPQLLTFSAKSEQALNKVKTDIQEYLHQYPDVNLEDVAYTLQKGRKRFPWRSCMVAKDSREAAELLKKHENLKTRQNENSSSDIVFMFPGQGSQYVNMGRELYENEPVFRKHMDRCAELIKTHLEIDIIDLVYPEESFDLDKTTKKLQNTKITQPVLFAVEYALAKLWISWGIEPAAVVGHSSGEYSAACVAGILSLEDGIALITERARLMASVPEGSMLAISLSAEKVLPLIEDAGVSLAGANSRIASVVSGSDSHIKALKAKLDEKDIGCRILHTSIAAHSHFMEPVLEDFRKVVEPISFGKPSIPFLSTTTGDWATADELATPEYWVRNIREHVKFAAAIDKLQDQALHTLLEVGPGQTLSLLARQQQESNKQLITAQSLRHPKQKEPDQNFILQNLGQLWMAGAKIDWEALHESSHCQRIPLPTYPFERKRYWMQCGKKEVNGTNQTARKKATGEVSEWLYRPAWQQAAPLSLENAVQNTEKWLIFEDQREYGRQLAKKCGIPEDQLIRVKPGPHFSQTSNFIFTINPDHPADYNRLINAMHGSEFLPDRIVHLWGLYNEGCFPSKITFESNQKFNFYSLLYLVQALDEEEVDKEMKLEIFTNALHLISGMERSDLSSATLLGLAKVILIEYPHLRCHSVDLDFDNTKPEQIIDAMADELSAANRPDVIACRGPNRWEKIFEPKPQVMKPNAIKTLKKGGVYLITGGLGEVGYLFAEYLAKNYGAKLIIVGRTELPDAAEWEHHIMKNDTEDPIADKVNKLLALNKSGTEVKYIQADASNSDELKQAFDAAINSFGALHGVIHAAGDVSMKPIDQLNKADCESYFDAKAYGTLNMETLISEMNPDFVLNISSVSSFLGGYGFAGYAASNSYMDYLTHYMSTQNSTRMITINWDAIESKTTTQWINEDVWITKKQVKTIFDSIVNSSFSGQILASSIGDIKGRMTTSVAAPSANKTDINIKEDILQAPAGENPEEHLLKSIWKEYLGVDAVSTQDDFFQLGGSSLTAVQIFNRIQQETGIKISMAKIFDHPTIAQLVSLLQQERVEDKREELEI